MKQVILAAAIVFSLSEVSALAQSLQSGLASRPDSTRTTITRGGRSYSVLTPDAICKALSAPLADPGQKFADAQAAVDKVIKQAKENYAACVKPHLKFIKPGVDPNAALEKAAKFVADNDNCECKSAYKAYADLDDTIKEDAIMILVSGGFDPFAWATLYRDMKKRDAAEANYFAQKTLCKQMLQTLEDAIDSQAIVAVKAIKNCGKQFDAAVALAPFAARAVAKSEFDAAYQKLMSNSTFNILCNKHGLPVKKLLKDFTPQELQQAAAVH